MPTTPEDAASQDSEESKLALPSFGLRRRKRAARPDPEPAATEPADAADSSVPEPKTEPDEAEAADADETVVLPVAEDEPETAPAADEIDVEDDSPVEARDDEPDGTAGESVHDSGAGDPARVDWDDESGPAADDTAGDDTTADDTADDDTAVLATPATEPDATAAQVDADQAAPPLFADELDEPDDDRDPAPDEQPEPDAGPAPVERRPHAPLTLPPLDGRLAAVFTGLVVGLVGVLLVFLFQRGCEAVKGAGSCGGAGVLLLIVVLVLMVFAGGALLRAWRQSDPLSTSFLAVGLVAVAAMLFFLPVIDRWFMVVVIPLIGAGFFLLSWWITSAFAENSTDPDPDPADARARARQREHADG